ncbi:MAG: Ca-activated chloride channel family protein [Halioglobus sp.]|jgi:Ca-activated chloride channel family protein
MPDFSQFHLMRPEWLWALVPALMLTVLLWRARSRSGGWSDVIAADLLPFLIGKHAGKKAPNLLPFVCAAWMIATLGASGPSWEKIPQPIHQKQDAMILVLDLSYSMKAGDLAPSRLDRARQKLLDLLALRQEGQTGLVAYAGDSHIVTPLTDDHPTIANLLPALSPDMMPVPGSNAAAAIEQAIELMHSAGVAQGQIVLVTDGVDAQGRADIADMIGGSGMTLSVLGVGTPNGAPIPLLRGGFLKDDKGTIAIPKLDISALKSLASNSSGRYLNIQINDSDLETLLSDTILPGSEQTQALDRTADAWEDKGYLLTLLLIPFALPLFRKGWVIALVPAMLIMTPDNAMAQNWDNWWLTADQQGQRALEGGDSAAAAELFDNPDWAGTAAYRKDDFEAAYKQFSKTQTASALYNQGNALAKGGKLEEAIDAYKESLELQPDAIDTAENLALLEKLKEQQEQQEQQQDDSEKSDEENQDKSEQQQDSDSQDPSDSSQENQDGEQNDEQSDTQEPPSENEDNQEPSEPEESEAESEPEDPQDQPAEPEEPEPASEEEKEAAAAQAEESSAQDEEEEQAMQQWLRRIPDDPSGLLREKFRYESQQRQEQGGGKRHEIY